MKKIILIPDSFKGTMSSCEICDIMKSAIEKNIKDSQIISVPVADGGEGSVDAFLTAVGGAKRYVAVKGPYFEDTDVYYGIIDNGKTAVIEMATCAGLPLVEGRKNPLKTTTYGVGQLILDAAEYGCEKIILCLGGSCTNDAGAGMASAVGVKFFNNAGAEFVPTGGTLSDIRRISFDGIDNRLKNIKITAMCDIDNPLYGENGAAYVFAPQKGADVSCVEELDRGLIHICSVVKDKTSRDYSQLKGAGAAGGMGFGMAAFLNASLVMGIEVVLDTVKFDELVKDADLVISGEGKIDTQSIRGKVVIGVAKRTKKAGVPLIAVVGDIGDDIEEAYNLGVSGIFSTNRVAVPFSESKKRAKSDMYHTVDNIFRFLCSIK